MCQRSKKVKKMSKKETVENYFLELLSQEVGVFFRDAFSLFFASPHRRSKSKWRQRKTFFFRPQKQKKVDRTKISSFPVSGKKIVRNLFLFKLKKFDRPFFSGKFVQVKVSTVRDFQFAFRIHLVALAS